MHGSSAAFLDDGNRLHLHHGPIDLVIGADAAGEAARQRAFAAAAARFDGLLADLVVDLKRHRSRLLPGDPDPRDPVARRMYDAARPHCGDAFLTPMIAVAGAVADEVLQAMLKTGPLDRAYVNNGGDIAVHLAGDRTFSVAMALQDGRDIGRIAFGPESGIGGVATSGAGGRSFSMGIADSVTVLASSAASADVAATLIANAVDLPDHPAIRRERADSLQPDSDLGERTVVTHVPPLDPGQCDRALARGRAVADRMLARGLIRGAALFLQGRSALLGDVLGEAGLRKEIEHV